MNKYYKIYYIKQVVYLFGCGHKFRFDCIFRNTYSQGTQNTTVCFSKSKQVFFLYNRKSK